MTKPSRITGQDFRTATRLLGIPDSQVQHLLGLQQNTFLKHTKQNATEPLRDVSLCLMTRLINQHPKIVNSQNPNIRTIISLLEERGLSFSDETLSALFGRESSTIYRWTNARSQPAGTVNIIMKLFKDYLEADEIEGVNFEEFLDIWKNIVREEAASRGLVDPFFCPKGWGVKIGGVNDEAGEEAPKKLMRPNELRAGGTVGAKETAKLLGCSVGDLELAVLDKSSPYQVPQPAGSTRSVLEWYELEVTAFADQCKAMQSQMVSEHDLMEALDINVSQLDLLKTKLYPTRFKEKKYFINTGSAPYYPKRVLDFLKRKFNAAE